MQKDTAHIVAMRVVVRMVMTVVIRVAMGMVMPVVMLVVLMPVFVRRIVGMRVVVAVLMPMLMVVAMPVPVMRIVVLLKSVNDQLESTALAYLLLVDRLVRVGARAIVSMSMVVVMPVAVPVSMMMMTSSSPHAEEIDSQTQRGNQEQLAYFHLRRVDTVVRNVPLRMIPYPHSHSLYGLKDNEDGDQDQEAAYGQKRNGHEPSQRTVGKATERLDSRIAIGIPSSWPPSSSHRCPEANSEAKAVEKHVNGCHQHHTSPSRRLTIRDQTQGIRPHSISHLDAHIRQIEQEEVEYTRGSRGTKDSLEMWPPRVRQHAEPRPV